MRKKYIVLLKKCKTRVKNEVKSHNTINGDVNFLKENDYIYESVQKQIIYNYESQINTRDKSKVIDFLKDKLKVMIKRIEKLIGLQNLLYIDPKNQIKIEQDKRNNKLYIKDDSHIKK